MVCERVFRYMLLSTIQRRKGIVDCHRVLQKAACYKVPFACTPSACLSMQWRDPACVARLRFTLAAPLIGAVK